MGADWFPATHLSREVETMETEPSPQLQRWPLWRSGARRLGGGSIWGNKLHQPLRCCPHENMQHMVLLGNEVGPLLYKYKF